MRVDGRGPPFVNVGPKVIVNREVLGEDGGKPLCRVKSKSTEEF